MRRLVVGISGASGMPLAHTLLCALRQIPHLEIHLVVSQGAQEVLRTEGGAQGTGSQAGLPLLTDLTGLALLTGLAHVIHAPCDTGAAPASGSWQHEGMIVCPCSMATLAAIATGAGTNLLHRAADVTLKERRPLLLIPRETPLSRVHLRNMLAAQEAGAVIMPFCPAFYAQPASIADLLEHMTGRILDQLGLPHSLGQRWKDTPPQP